MTYQTLVIVLVLFGTILMRPSGRHAAASQNLVEYRDPDGRFVFSYPASFGTPERGTDSGFGDRVASIRFSTFSAGGIGGEAVLNARRPTLDVQAAGGLYDDITSGTLPPAVVTLVHGVLPRLSPANVCEHIGREQHIDVTASSFATLSAKQRSALADLDRMGNRAPNVTRCSVSDDVVVFEKDAGMVEGSPRRRTYGAVKFLTGRYAAFQLVRAGGTPDASIIEQMRQVVSSFRQSNADSVSPPSSVERMP